MTTVCYKNGILAFDSRVCANNMIIQKEFIKGIKTENYLCAYAGDVGFGEMFLEWVKNGMNPSDPPKTMINNSAEDLEALVIDKRGNVTLWNSAPSGMLPVSLGKISFYAIGTGAEFAFGAMEAGFTAKEAVEVAIKYDHNSGQPVKTISFKRRK